MGDSREESPDWLRSFQPPSYSAVELSSGSESPPDCSPGSDDEDGLNLSKLFNKGATKISDSNDANNGRGHTESKSDKGKSPKKNEKGKQTPVRKRKNEEESKEGKMAKRKNTGQKNKPEKHDKSYGHNHTIWSLSSDSESGPDRKPVTVDEVAKMDILANEEEFATEHGNEIGDVLLDDARESPTNGTSNVKSSVKNMEEGDEKTSMKKAINTSIDGENNNSKSVVKEEVSRKHPGPQVATSTVPLLLPEKVQLSKALVECEGDSIDLSGDVGSVGRVVISEDPSKNQEMLLDLKGTIYKTTIVPSRTFCVVSFSQSEAKIEAIMNDYIQLKPQSNVYEAETMVEGTLDGFSFDSEDEGEKATAQADKTEAADDQHDAETMRKPGKATGPGRKKGKPTGGKQLKKVKKKPQVSKKSKSKK
ncbi:DNA-binding protein BIN4 [Andrographis paniculata]|uniref:DNA-binding protein BIN4 n=1 Tax=Andrographis paniculata TaxID=175694 RepID=UPI0021E85397|nr:DNA-binding protein BIN4 [Andrographis paniculata]